MIIALIVAAVIVGFLKARKIASKLFGDSAAGANKQGKESADGVDSSMKERHCAAQKEPDPVDCISLTLMDDDAVAQQDGECSTPTCCVIDVVGEN